MAHKRPTASDVPPSIVDIEPAVRRGEVPSEVDGLSAAQQRAMRRCAPLTSADIQALRRIVRKGGVDDEPMPPAHRAL